MVLQELGHVGVEGHGNAGNSAGRPFRKEKDQVVLEEFMNFSEREIIMRYHGFVRKLLEYRPTVIRVLFFTGYTVFLHSPRRYLRSKHAEKHEKAQDTEYVFPWFHYRMQK